MEILQQNCAALVNGKVQWSLVTENDFQEKEDWSLILVKFLSPLSFLSEHIETKWNLTFSVLSRSEKLKFIFSLVSQTLARDEVCYFEQGHLYRISDLLLLENQ